jgi:hypothetical protein
MRLFPYFMIIGLFSCDSNLTRQKESRGRLPSQIQETSHALLELSSEEVVARLLDSRVAQQEKENILESLLFSDDLFALETLIEVTVKSSDAALRRRGERALIERARRQGLERVAESAEPWLPVLSIEYSPAVYRAGLQLLDRSLPHAARLANLRLIYRESPLFALRISGALAFDLEERGHMAPIFVEFVQDALELTTTPEHSSAALLLVHPQLRKMFPEDMEHLTGEVPAEDREWVLEQLALQHSPLFKVLVRGMELSDMAEPVRFRYVDILRDEDEVLRQEVIVALFRGMVGRMERSDLAVLGTWIDQRSVLSLLAVIGENPNSELSIRAYEMLFEKSIHLEPVATLVSWIRKNRWKHRSQYRELVGVIGNRDLLSEERVASTLRNSRHHMVTKNLLDALLKVSDPSFVLLLLNNVEEEMSLGRRLTLLNHDQEQVRILGVKSLDGCSDFGALKVILDNYEKEKSKTVRYEYEATFPEVRRRAESNSSSQYSFDEL